MLDATEVTAASEAIGTAVDRVYRYVKAEILARRIKAHDVLSEGQIAGVVGVSRTPVREALLRLESEGVLRLLPKRGALVLPVTTEQMMDLIETRRLVETFAVRKVIAGGGVGPLVHSLRHQLELMRAAMVDRDGAAYVNADREFHAEIVAAAGNSILSDLYLGLREQQLRMGAVNLLDGAAADASRMKSTLAEHEQIAHAIAGRRSRVAETAVRAHLDRSERLLGLRH